MNREVIKSVSMRKQDLQGHGDGTPQKAMNDLRQRQYMDDQRIDDPKDSNVSYIVDSRDSVNNNENCNMGNGKSAGRKKPPHSPRGDQAMEMRKLNQIQLDEMDQSQHNDSFQTLQTKKSNKNINIKSDQRSKMDPSQ